MRIAWFSDTWLPARDGVVNSLLSFKQELERRGHEIFLFVPNSITKDNIDHGIFFYKAKSFRPYPVYRMPAIRSLFSSRTYRLVTSIKPDLIHAHSPGVIGLHGMITANRLKLPFVFTYHTFLRDSVYMVTDSSIGQQLIRRLLTYYLNWFFRQCHRVIVPSQAAKLELTSLIQGPTRVVPTGIDIGRFADGNGTRVRAQLGVHNAPIILHVGRVVKEKNLDDLLAAAPLILKTVPDAVFVIVGAGPYDDSLHHSVLEKGLRKHVILTGFVPDEDLPDFYAAANVFAFPSTYETQGIVALEAMAAGIPIVAARSRSLPELVEEGRNGYLFSPHNSSELANKLVKALGAKNMVAAAQAMARRYSLPQCADRLLEVYGELI
jgi:1,2-diacylglycerol 3-alpha-glucosyltransferase